MKKKSKIFAMFGVFGLLVTGAYALSTAASDTVMKADASDLTTVEITGPAALCSNIDTYNFTFTMKDQGNITTSNGAMFTISDKTKVYLERDGQKYYAGANTESILLEKRWIYDGIDAFYFKFSSAWFSGTEAQDGDKLTFDDAQYYRDDTTASKHFVVNITKTTFTYTANVGWSTDNGSVSGTVSLDSGNNDPANKNLRFKATTMPTGLFGRYADYQEYIPTDDQSGVFINNIYQSGAFLTYLPTGVFNVAWGGTLVYDYDTGKGVARSTLKEGDIISIRGTFYLSLKTSSGRTKENSTFTIDPFYVTVSNSKFAVADPTIYEVECLGDLHSNAINYWFSLTTTPIPNDTVLTVPSTYFTLIRDGARYHPAYDTLPQSTFIQTRSDTMPGYFFSIQNSWFGGQSRTPQAGDQLEIGGDAYYVSGGQIYVLRIKPFVSCFDGSSSKGWHAGHKTEVTCTWAEDNSEATFSFTDCEVCGTHIHDVTVTPTREETPATCTEAKKVGLVAKANVAGVLRTDSKQVSEGEPLGHLYGTPSYAWNEAGTECTAKAYCTRAGCTAYEEETVTATLSTVVEAKCLETGVGRYTATFANPDFASQSHDIILPALGHDFTSNEWHWAEDYSSATVTFHCSRCEVAEDKTATVTSGVTQEQSCTKPEIITYTAVCQFDGKTYLDSITVETKEPAGHTYETGTWKWDDDHLTATFTTTCVEGDSTITRTVDAVITREESTTTVKGKKTYTVSVTIGDKTFTDSYVEELPLAPAAAKSGCGGSVAAISGTLAAISLMGIALVSFRKRKEK